MNLYSRKQRWKIVLFLAALAIAASSLWYTSHIIRKIKEDERLRIEIWSNAIRIQVNQLYLTNRMFDKIKAEETKRVQLYARALEELGKDLTDYTFALDVIKTNETVPVIVTDAEGHYNTSGNLDFSDSTIAIIVRKQYPDKPEAFQRLKVSEIFNDSIQAMKTRWSANHKPIPISFRGKAVSYVFYKESKLFDELQHRKDSLVSRFNHELVNNAALVPVIFTDSSRRNIIATNLDRKEIGDNPETRLAAMSGQNTPIEVKINENKKGYIYYEDSKVLTQIRLFPYIQTVIVGIFLLITYLIFNTFKSAEQNQVWAGMAKETAHQLGTPLSSLMAWNEILRSSGTDETITREIEKDINRLNTVSERFSKIGSEPTLSEVNLGDLIEKFVQYLKPRVSKNMEISIDEVPLKINVKANASLLEWVFENISKNAIDAMEGNGRLSFSVTRQENRIYIDITDTGKGIPSNRFKTVFKPGYSTKQRGWGLGLSLVKRIVEEYHKGKIFVLRSEPGKGTTFRVTLPVAETA